MSDSVRIVEVGPRDGLQNEAPVPVEQRVRLIDASGDAEQVTRRLLDAIQDLLP